MGPENLELIKSKLSCDLTKFVKLVNLVTKLPFGRKHHINEYVAILVKIEKR